MMNRWRFFIGLLSLGGMLAGGSLKGDDSVPALSEGKESSPELASASLHPQVESMYSKGLAYLQKNQQSNGTWLGNYGTEPGVVGLILMAFLAHGDDPNTGVYHQNIALCTEYILGSQNEKTGYIGNSMYTHGFATLALAEAYGMVDNDRIGPALKKAVDLILSSQAKNPLGVWRYFPEAADGDTTVSGCQMMALFAARNAGLSVPQEALEKAHKYMMSCRTEEGSYGYTNAQMGRVTLTAIGSLVLSIDKKKESEEYKKTLAFLRAQLNYREDAYPFYFEYYMAQALFHADEALWRQWNERNMRFLYATQRADGSWDAQGAPSYATAMALLSLALNYRFLPIYEK